jgi:hypothetical protein
MGKSEGKRSLERPKLRSEDNIKIVRREVECDGIYWIHLVEDGCQWRAILTH